MYYILKVKNKEKEFLKNRLGSYEGDEWGSEGWGWNLRPIPTEGELGERRQEGREESLEYSPNDWNSFLTSKAEIDSPLHK